VSLAGREPSFIVAATGLRAEARIAARAGRVRAVAGGGDDARLELAIEQQVAEGGRAILSFGMAAGLAPGLAPGTCLIGGEILDAGTSFSADAAWSARLLERLGAARRVTIAGVDRPLATAAAKRTLNAETGAVAADMESHVVARLAARHGLPFAVLRVVADPAERELPPAALAAMREDGGIGLPAVLGSLLKHPAQMPALFRLAADARAARAALLRCHDLLGPGLGFRDLG
jgi:adenosylhomocysteine nucleosidase